MFKKSLPDNQHLYAHWDFNQPRQHILKDVHTDCDGVLRGSPIFSNVEGRGVLQLHGKQYAVVEGHVVDSRNITFDLRLRWAGGTGEQRVFEFGDAQNALWLALDKKGKPAFVIQKGKDNVSSVQGNTVVPKGKWCRISISVQDGVGRLFVDGQLAGENPRFALKPEDVQARSGFIGSGSGASQGFTGELDDLAVYRTGFSNIRDIPSVIPSESGK